MSNEIQKAELPDEPEGQAGALVTLIDRLARDPNVDVDKMERLLAMQERVFERRAEVAFNQAMARVQAEGVKVRRARKNEQTRSTYADIEAISDALTPIAAKEGFSLSYGTDKSDIEGWIRITCDVAHVGGHKVHRYVDLPLDTEGIAGKKNKTDMHGAGSTLSYGRRYLKLLIFDVATTDDDDGQRGGGNLRRQQIHDAMMQHADSIEVIRQCIDEHYNGLGDLIRAFEAWHELPDDDKATLWIAPSKCREMGIEPVFTTEQIKAFKSSAWSEARSAVIGSAEP